MSRTGHVPCSAVQDSPPPKRARAVRTGPFFGGEGFDPLDSAKPYGNY